MKNMALEGFCKRKKTGDQDIVGGGGGIGLGKVVKGCMTPFRASDGGLSILISAVYGRLVF